MRHIFFGSGIGLRHSAILSRYVFGTYKTIILGRNGSKIKIIGTEARKEIDEALGVKSHLFLFVKVRKDWEDNPMIYKDLGLKFVE